MPWLDPSKRSHCPCCGYPTLGTRGGYEICQLCWWEDDGQDEADEVRGGPNHSYSLAQARHNFQEFGVMYEPDRDRRLGGPDSELMQSAKRALMTAFNALPSASPSARPAILAEIRQQERALELELKRRIKEHDERCRKARRSEHGDS